MEPLIANARRTMAVGILASVCVAALIAGCAGSESSDRAAAGAEPSASAEGSSGSEAGSTVVAEESGEDAYPRTVTDSYGNETVIESADSVVAAYSVVSETLFGLGMGDRLVGRGEFDTWPPGLIEEVPSIGSYTDLNPEGVVSLGADLLIITDRYLGFENDTVKEQLEAAGVTVLVLPTFQRAEDEGGFSMELIEDRVRMIADAMAVPDRGEQLIGLMRYEVATAEAAAETSCKEWDVLNVLSRQAGEPYAVTGGGSIGELFIELTGGRDVAVEAGLDGDEGGFVEVEPEAVVELAPEVIFGVADLWEGDEDGVAYHRELAGTAETPAAEAGRILPVKDLRISGSWRMPGHARELAEELAALPC